MVTGSLLPRPLPRAAAFSMLAGVLFLIFMASAAPSPLYRVYQGEWRVSATTPTGALPGFAPTPLVWPPFVRSRGDGPGRRARGPVALGRRPGASRRSMG